jgi:signal transduction histidine kinase
MEHASFEKADLLAILDNVVEDANFEARAVNKSVIMTCPESLEEIRMNPELVRRAVENIVRNAVRYTPEGTSVSVAVESGSDNKGVVVKVTDHGPGVPEEELELIFKPFYRTEASRSRDTGGSGLGLAIAQKAILAHGGRIHAELPPGGGLLVVMWLPV